MEAFLPLLFVALLFGGLALFGFGNAAAALVAAARALPPAAQLLLAAGRAALQRLTRAFWYFFWMQVLLNAIAMAIIVWGITEDSYRRQIWIISLGGLLFGAQLVVWWVLLDGIEDALRYIHRTVVGIEQLIAAAILRFLTIFRVATPPTVVAPATPAAAATPAPINRKAGEQVFGRAALLWFWNVMWLLAFPNWIMLGLLLPLDFFLIYGGILVRWLRRPQYFWRWTLLYMLPFCLGVVLAHAVFPEFYKTVSVAPERLMNGIARVGGKFFPALGTKIETEVTGVSCDLDPSVSGCDRVLLGRAKAKLERVVDDGEELAIKHGGSAGAGIGSTGLTPGPGPSPLPLPPPGGTDDSDAPPPPPPPPPFRRAGP